MAFGDGFDDHAFGARLSSFAFLISRPVFGLGAGQDDGHRPCVVDRQRLDGGGGRLIVLGRASDENVMDLVDDQD